MAFSMNDLRRKWYCFKLVLPESSLLSVGDLEDKYWQSVSGLAPSAQFSLSDHKLAYLRGLYPALLPANMATLWAQYVIDRSGLTPPQSVSDHEYAYYRSQLGL